MARREWQALSKGHKAELALWGGSPWASQEGAICGVMPLDKDWAIACEACLAASPFLAR
ncbi:MAG: hypothetical protein KZQ89_14350 [Candidatus Thiodiazotropha sp. (ex Lucinoma kastoroae)]|nr:hypothetical protein [Candidatus Thiodiazotropha sp. (ex Lucinoma kastoroae)]MCU7859648.1 hypothetical protein [Candidatus Thiodiazotropha sp. (ex Lucinoma kastoroae)]